MKSNINLLPAEVQQKSRVKRLSSYFAKLTTLLAGLLIVLGVGMGIYMIVLSLQLSGVRGSISELENSLKALAKTQSQYVLVRDRVDKIKPLVEKKSAADNGTLFRNLLSKLPSDIKISEVQIESEKMEFTFSTKDSSNLIGVFSAVSGDSSLGQVLLTNFNYGSQLGYIATLKMQVKK
jgi:hypothetical protein